MAYGLLKGKKGITGRGGINTALGRMRYALINLRKLAEEQNIDLAQK